MQNIQQLARASSCFFFSDCSAILVRQLTICTCVRAFTLVFARNMWIPSVHIRDQRRFYAPRRSCEFTARVPLCPVRARSFARVHVNLRPASCSHENVPSSSSSDPQPTVDDASSRTSRSESSLSLTLPFLHRLVPLFLLLLLFLLLHLRLVVLFPSFLSFSFALSL